MFRGLPSRVIHRYFGDYFNSLNKIDQDIIKKLEHLDQIARILESSRENVAEIADKVSSHDDLLKIIYQKPHRDRDELKLIRESVEYKEDLKKDNPLISVRIATYNRADLLCNLAIPSILNQTYQNFEIVVVGDHTDLKTEENIRKLNDSRIKYHNLPSRSWYPEDKYKRWLVVGTTAANEAVRRCKGEWVATLDDDDSFRPTHLETLLGIAKKDGVEFAYGALESTHLTTGKKKTIWSNPPKPGEFSLMSAIYLRQLSNIFMVDEYGWAMREPQDWYLCRRMIEAGVTMSTEKKVTGDINLLEYKEKKDV